MTGVQPSGHERFKWGAWMKEVVYIVDDDASVRDGLGDLLRSVGLGVQTFASSQEFLDSKRADAPGCLILDVRLPGRSGLEFQKVLQDLSIQLPVIFISAHGDVPISVRAMKSGAIEFLTKPLREQELLDAVHAGIERDRARRQEAELHRRTSGALRFVDGPRARNDAPRGHRQRQQADRRASRAERDNREGPSRPRHAKDAGEISCRSGPNGGQPGCYGKAGSREIAALRIYQCIITRIRVNSRGMRSCVFH